MQATWVPIIYFFFFETKARELEAFNQLFAGEENEAITTMHEAERSSRPVDSEKSLAAIGS